MNTINAMCHNKIGLYAQNIDTTIASIVNTIGRPCETTPKERGYSLEVQAFRNLPVILQ